MLTLKMLPCTNVTLTLTMGWTTLFMGDMGQGPTPRQTGLLTVHHI
jgi:hypothetical protein